MKKILLYAGMILALAAVSCTPAETPTDPSKDPSSDTPVSADPSSNAGTESGDLKLTSTAEVTIDAEDADLVTITFEAPGDWTATSDADWFVITPDKGKGNGTIQGAANDNEEAEDRTATVTITCGSDKITVTVVQAGIWAPYFDLLNEGVGQFSGFGEGDPLYVDAEGGEIDLEFATNLDWYYYLDNGTDEGTDDLGWISIKGSGTTLTVTVKPTDSYAARVEYVYIGCSLDGDYETYGGYGACILVSQDPLPAPTEPLLVWTKDFNDLTSTITSGIYARLAFSNGELLLSDGSAVYGIDPSYGTLNATYSPAVEPHSIDSDDEGNLIIMSDVPAETDESGAVVGPTNFTIYWASGIEDTPKALYSFNYAEQAWGIVGNFRVRGDLASGKAVVTAAVGGSRFYYAWAFDNGDYVVTASDLDPIRSTLAYGNINTDGNTPDQIGVISVSSDKLTDGILTRGYMCYYNGTGWEGARQVWCRMNPTIAHWTTPEWRQIVPDGYGDDGNECQGNIDVLEIGGKRIMAYTQGQHFNWGYGEANIYVFDITDLGNAKFIANIKPEEWIADHKLCPDGARGADVLLRDEDGNIALYAVHSYGRTVAKYVFSVE